MLQVIYIDVIRNMMKPTLVMQHFRCLVCMRRCDWSHKAARHAGNMMHPHMGDFRLLL